MMESCQGSVTKAIDEAVESFESARDRDGRADLEKFLPAPEHPFYLAVLCELVRVDLEYSYQEKRTGRLEDYQRRFPELFRDGRRVREIAFEDFRLRREAGDSPSLEDYRDRFGVDGFDPPATDPELVRSPPSEAASLEAVTGFSRNVRERIAWMTLVVALSVAIAAALTLGLISRQRSIERAKALDVLNRLNARVGEAEFLLLVPDASRQKIDEGIAICRRSIDVLRVRTDPRWLDRLPASSLSEPDLLRLRRNVSVLLGLWARALAWRAEAATDRRAELIAEAQGLINLAEATSGPDGTFPDLKLQSAALARLAGRGPDADRLLAEAEEMPSETASDRLLLVSSYLDRGLDRQALALAEEASRLDPLDSSAWLIRGHCLARLSQDERADQSFSIAITLRPGLSWAYADRGLIALNRRQFDRAIADFDRALTIDPDLAEALLNRAEAKLRRADAQGAIADVDRLLGLPDAPTRGLFLRAEAHEARGDHAAAEADRREGFFRTPGDEASWISVGLNLLPDDPAGALKAFRAARKLVPKSLAAFRNEARVLSEALGRTEEAVIALDQALAYHPQAVSAITERAILLARLGRRAEAHKDSAASLSVDDSAETLFRAARTFALTSKAEPADALQSLRFLALAARKDDARLGQMESDPDLATLRHRPEYARLRDALRIVCPPIASPN